MSIVFLLSVILKGLGAVLEVLLQVMITRMLGLAGYGTYSTWVSAADLVYWVLFSGITKCNTFYLSNKGTELRRFKAKYYSCYVLPVLTTLALVLALEKGRGGYTVIALITGMELLVMDHSSTMMAQGQPGCALFGEYVLGRLFLVLGTLVLYKTERFSLGTLLALYVIQYAGILVLFLIKRDREPRRDISKELSLRKWGSYQRADLIQALISQMPILLQYFFTGAFEAGIVSVVLMVKKLVNFISGPTAKVFLPEFSRMYHAGDKAGIKQCYASIMRIQMLFAGSMAVVLVGYPQVLLSILAEELLPYTKQFVGCALVFILIATLGPCSGVLQMTGNEKKDNLYREAALGVMLVLLFVMRGSRLVMLYALCVQALLETNSVYIYIPDEKLKIYGDLLRIITAQSMEYFSSRPPEHKKMILFCLDEFASFGKLQITEALRKLRKRHIRIMVLTQSLADLDMIYGKDERKAMLGNFKFTVLLGCKDTETQEYFSKMIGEKRSLLATDPNQKSQPIIKPADLAHLEQDLFVICDDGAIRLRKNFYFK